MYRKIIVVSLITSAVYKYSILRRQEFAYLNLFWSRAAKSSGNFVLISAYVISSQIPFKEKYWINQN